MTEKKTFKHPRIVYTWSNDEIVGWGISQFPAESFSSDEWDMEVTFTKKRGPVESGQWRELGGIGREGRVVHLGVYGSVAGGTVDPEDLWQGRKNGWAEPISRLRSGA